MFEGGDLGFPLHGVVQLNPQVVDVGALRRVSLVELLPVSGASSMQLSLTSLW